MSLTAYCYFLKRLSQAAAMSTGGPPAALSMRPLQNPITLVSATSPGSRPGQATTVTSHHPRSHTQRPTPPSKFALVLSWIGRTKLYLGAAIGTLTLIVTIVSLLSSFAGDRYSREALELALWTARKDYVEACQTVCRLRNPVWLVVEVVAAKIDVSISIIRTLIVNKRWNRDCHLLLAWIDSPQGLFRG